MFQKNVTSMSYFDIHALILIILPEMLHRK